MTTYYWGTSYADYFDAIWYYPDSWWMEGYGGDDTLIGERYSDTIFGGSGNDWIFGLEGNDYLFGESGHDWIEGGSGHDWLEGGSGVDVLLGGFDNDVLLGGSDADYLFGESGHDYLDGGFGDDYLDGGSGADTIFGGSGIDILIGGSSGNDILVGGFDNDLLLGNDCILTGASSYNSYEIDILISDSTSDTDYFYLGDSMQSYYLGDGYGGYAYISDFDASSYNGEVSDLLVLNGSTSYYAETYSGISYLYGYDFYSGSYDFIAAINTVDGAGIDLYKDVIYV